MEVFRNIQCALILHPYNGVDNFLSLCTLGTFDPRLRIETLDATITGRLHADKSHKQDPDVSTCLATIVNDRLPGLRTLNITIAASFFDPRQYTKAEIKRALPRIAGVDWRGDPDPDPREFVHPSFLASLSKVKATVRITLLRSDCYDYFEEEYVKKGEWILVDVNKPVENET